MTLYPTLLLVLKGTVHVIGECLRGRYAIVARIGQGGMGAVYLAEDQRLKGRRVAVKVIPINSAAGSAANPDAGSA